MGENRGFIVVLTEKNKWTVPVRETEPVFIATIRAIECLRDASDSEPPFNMVFRWGDGEVTLRVSSFCDGTLKRVARTALKNLGLMSFLSDGAAKR